MSILIIDLSYFNFYRFYATKQWYKNAHTDEVFEQSYDWSLNSIFWDKFKKMFLATIDTYRKKLKPTQIIFAKDCKRVDIWRNVFYNEYKANREETYIKTEFQGGKVFRRCYDEILPDLLKDTLFKLYNVPQLEADDIIYLTIKSYNSRPIVPAVINVISSDCDLLQILEAHPNVNLLDAKMVSYNHKSLPSNIDNIFTKCILGDSSDNIPKSLEKIGEKTCIKLLADYSLLLDNFRKNSNNFNNFCRNKCIIDFKYIPTEFEEHFKNKYIV